MSSQTRGELDPIGSLPWKEQVVLGRENAARREAEEAAERLRQHFEAIPSEPEDTRSIGSAVLLAAGRPESIFDGHVVSLP
jgi:hypothetical protein